MKIGIACFALGVLCGVGGMFLRDSGAGNSERGEIGDVVRSSPIKSSRIAHQMRDGSGNPGARAGNGGGVATPERMKQIWSFFDRVVKNDVDELGQEEAMYQAVKLGGLLGWMDLDELDQFEAELSERLKSDKMWAGLGEDDSLFIVDGFIIHRIFELDPELALARASSNGRGLGEIPWNSWAEKNPADLMRNLKANLAIPGDYYPNSSDSEGNEVNEFFEDSSEWESVISAMVKADLDPHELLKGAAESPKKAALTAAIRNWEISETSDPKELISRFSDDRNDREVLIRRLASVNPVQAKGWVEQQPISVSRDQDLFTTFRALPASPEHRDWLMGQPLASPESASLRVEQAFNNFGWSEKMTLGAEWLAGQPEGAYRDRVEADLATSLAREGRYQDAVTWAGSIENEAFREDTMAELARISAQEDDTTPSPDFLKALESVNASEGE